MLPKILTNAQLEEVYDRIAEALDAVPAERRQLFLAKLALALANLLGDPAKVAQALEAAARDLD
ncbi:DUF2783 domain-containing protein [Roseicella aquatilis]|uniref:DUF2783 domain-containing protein n=1 Tax=Roseicella aquatilis TaxID=2527868 RepID=A0A4R4DQA7_9PROT|nr:DUF2783 domain-containing protein [Roseicella aquatilis]TCZ63263.1 DUF2783 domain-containing protein [Roseicella aquatilis]